jgi:hypothetical protein
MMFWTKFLVVAICTMALTVSAHSQMRMMGVPGRSMGASGRFAVMSRFGAVRAMHLPGSGFVMPRRVSPRGMVSAPVAGRRHSIFSFDPFFNNGFFDPFFFNNNNGFFFKNFFRSAFCLQNPFFCRKLFFRAFLGFGSFNGFPFNGFPFGGFGFGGFPGGFPLVAGAVPVVTEPVAEDASLMQQEEAQAVAELQRELQEERLHREELERQVAGTRAQQETKLQPQNAPPESPTPATVLVFRDGTRTEIQNYAAMGKELYAFAPQGTKKILVSDLDVPATIEVNEERGVEFHLP